MQERFIALVIPLCFAVSVACGKNAATTSDFAGSEISQTLIPASPTNQYAENAQAAALGKQLFFDKGFSSDGTIGCVSCHDPANGFSDAKAKSVGVRGQIGDRHAMPITAAVFHPYLLWDGKADSVWSQPLKALENPKEMDFTRTEVAKRVQSNYRAGYEAVFGTIPDLSTCPDRAKPGDDAWTSMSAPQRDAVDRVFANFGKAIEAYERKLICDNTKFDRWTRGEATLTDAELAGGNTFRQSGCPKCHSGPSFSDGKFHDLGLPSTDRGRILGAAALPDDPFNVAGEYSDDPKDGATKLAAIATEGAQNGAFRTASLRGVGQRTFFGHASHERTLRGFITDVYRGGGGRGRRNSATVGTRDDLLDDVNVDGDDVDDLIAFLRTLDCPVTPDAAPPQ